MEATTDERPQWESGDYFALAPAELFAQTLLGRIQAGTQLTGDELMRQAWRTAYAAYYGIDGRGDTGAVTNRATRGGQVGELTRVRIAKARSIAKSLIGMLLGPAVTWDVKARNGDADARSSVLVASNLLEYYWKQGGFLLKAHEGLESALVGAESWLLTDWDTTQGDAVGLNTGGEAREGDARQRIVQAWDAFWDSDVHSPEDVRWVCLRVWENRFDLEAEFPLDALGAETKGRLAASKDDTAVRDITGMQPRQDSDVVPLYVFFHRDTPAVPGGMKAMVTAGGVLLEHRTLENGDAFPRRLSLENRLDTGYGYSTWWDLLGVESVYNQLQTAIASNQVALAVQSVAMEEGSSIDPVAVQGLRVMYTRPGAAMPQAVQLTSTPKEVFEHLPTLEAAMLDMMGLNDVAQGQPQTADMNAEAFTLLVSMAQQRNSLPQKRLMDWIAGAGKDLLQVLQHHVTGQRLVAIAGRHAVSTARDKEWSGSTLKPVQSVLVDLGDPLSQSAGGRMKLVDLLIQAAGPGNIDPADIQQVAETGRMEPAVNVVRDASLLMGAENEEMASGISPPVHFLDNHPAHVQHHQAVLFSPQARADAAVIKAVQSHIDWHYREYWQLPDGMAPKMDPLYATRSRMLLGQPPPMDAAPMGAPPPSPDGAPVDEVADALAPPPVGATPNPETPPPPGDAFDA